MSGAGSSGGGGGDAAFESFYSEVKAIEARDAKLTPKQQIERLLRPGSSYFNLNPFEVLQIEPSTTPEEARKVFKKMSLLIHPDKNPDDKERAEKAFDVIKGAMEMMNDPDELSRCREMVTEAKARTDVVLGEKRRKLKREGKLPTVPEDDPAVYKRSVWVLTNKLFADRERKKRTLEERANAEKKRRIDELTEAAEQKKHQDEYNKNFEESRDSRVNSWQSFQTKKTKEGKPKKLKGTFKPPKPRLEQR